MIKNPVVMIILDGWGERAPAADNAITLAPAVNFDRLKSVYPYTSLSCSGLDVGLPAGQMGNSEVGHLNIGAGRVVYQDIARISKAIDDGSFYKNAELCRAVELAIEKESALHILGLLSDGGVHSLMTHIYAMLELARIKGLERVFVHAFLDGRDVPPQSAVKYIDQLEMVMKEKKIGAMASLGGRYWGMDRDKRWERVEKAYRAMVIGDAPAFIDSRQLVESSYNSNISDEFIVHGILVDDDYRPRALISDQDSVVFINFRADRARQITRAFTDPGFNEFDRGTPPDVHYVCMTQYDAKIDAPVAFPPQNLTNTLGEYLAEKGLRQLRIAETEKYAHLTFFFNGGVETPNPGEERILIPSPKVATYDLKPEMSARLITEKAVQAIRAGEHDVIMINYANPDMVGHTGVLEAAVDAIRTVDDCLAQLVDEVLASNGVALITADHGNAEQMEDVSLVCPHTAHTTNCVPFILVGEAYEGRKLVEEGSLQDVAPTLLEVLGMAPPPEMTGKSLIAHESQ